MTAISRESAAYALKLIDQLKAIDAATNDAYWEMGRILSAIEHGNLFEVAYDSMTAFCEEELSYTVATARRYLNAYRAAKRLGYSKTATVELFTKHSFTAVSAWLNQAKEKVSLAAAGRQIERVRRSKVIVNFQLTKEDADTVRKVLVEHGAMIGENGRMAGSSAALMDLINNPGR